MNKEDILLTNYSLLIKDPIKNVDHIKMIISQLCVTNPKLALRCWQDILNNYKFEIESSEIEDGEFKYGTFGYYFIGRFESDLVGESSFVNALEEFSKNKLLLEMIYSKTPIESYFAAYYAISFLIKNSRLQEANSILSAIYKNKTFKAYGDLWKKIIHRFEYYELDNYCGGGWTRSNIQKESDIQEFCMSWAERIMNEEEKAIALTHIMRIF